MKKLITKSNENTINLSDIQFDINKYYIFYYSSNQGYPCFLTSVNDKYGFSPALLFASSSHFAYSARDFMATIEQASKYRELFAVHRSNWQEIFKSKP